MNADLLILSLVATALVVGFYFLGLFHGQNPGLPWRAFAAWMRSRFSRNGVVASVAISILWGLIFHTFVLHVRMALGRWPAFGEQLEAPLLSIHQHLVFIGAIVLVCSLMAVPVIALVALAVPRWRNLSLYSVAYAAGVGLAMGSLLLAPRPFLNWFFD